VPRTINRAARNSGISAIAAGWLSSARASNWTPVVMKKTGTRNPKPMPSSFGLELRVRGSSGQVDRPHQQPGRERAEDGGEAEPAGEHGEGQGQGQGGADAQLRAAVLEPVQHPVQEGQVPDPSEG
jgi:hypothetical protein